MLAKAKSTRVDNAYERLKTEILNGELPPGFQAPEPDIASRLGMSRTPVREALIRLEAEGLVDLIPRRGAKVLAVSQKDICEIFEILAVLEGLAAKSAARRDVPPALIQSVEDVMTRADAALAADDIEAWAKLDDHFHRLIAQSCGNTRLEAEVINLLDQVHRANRVLLRLNKAPASNVDDHRKIVEAIKSGQDEMASAGAQSHRLNGLNTMKRLLQSSGLTQV
ncbi:MAG: GntR family transcriptional regulator [Roseibium sp.]|uniref:GntR family transcriptional regulator n=1 Tax=Roseibium sp. TaxID=1936156 RepID=UPI00261DFE18|nr:GntR family transcriptional regulator [Roseibium sp.]MCV0424996.1 GntR family transcriptional regulator [Roseibium sp.]